MGREEDPALLSVERATTRNYHGSVAEVSKISRSKTQEGPPDEGNYTVRNPLLEGSHIYCVDILQCRYTVQIGNLAKCL